MTVIQGTMTKNSYFGERALLFDEPRTATVEVSSPEAELWSIEQGFLDDGMDGDNWMSRWKEVRTNWLGQMGYKL